MKNNIRNIFHIVAGFTLAYPVAKLTGLFPDNLHLEMWEKFLLAFVGLGIFSAFFGAAYEYLINKMNKEIIPNEKDIIRTSLGGSLVSVFIVFPFSLILSISLIVLCLSVLINDIYKILKNKK